MPTPDPTTFQSLGDFTVKLIVAFGGLSALIGAILIWNKDRFKLTIDNESVKRKEVAELLKELYDELKEELRVERHNNRNQMQIMELRHSNEVRNLYAIIEKKDIIINELIVRLPQEAREAVQARVQEVEKEIAQHTASIKQSAEKSTSTENEQG